MKVRVIKYWNILLSMVEGFLYLKMLKAHLEKALSNLFLLYCP